MWTVNDELISQTQTNASNLAMTPTNDWQYQQEQQQQQPLYSRDEVESSIKEFSKLWPSQNQTATGTNTSANRFPRTNDSRHTTISTNLLNNNTSANYSKRNGVLKSGGVAFAPITIEIDPNTWDLPKNSNNQPNERKFFHYAITSDFFFLCVSWDFKMNHLVGFETS